MSSQAALREVLRVGRSAYPFIDHVYLVDNVRGGFEIVAVGLAPDPDRPWEGDRASANAPLPGNILDGPAMEIVEAIDKAMVELNVRVSPRGAGYGQFGIFIARDGRIFTP